MRLTRSPLRLTVLAAAAAGLVAGAVFAPAAANAAPLTSLSPDAVSAQLGSRTAGSYLNADGKSLHAVGNVSYESPGFGDAQDGYRVRVNGGACNVSLDTSSASG